MVVVLVGRIFHSVCRYRAQKYPVEISLENSDFIVVPRTTAEGLDSDTCSNKLHEKFTPRAVAAVYRVNGLSSIRRTFLARIARDYKSSMHFSHTCPRTRDALSNITRLSAVRIMQGRGKTIVFKARFEELSVEVDRRGRARTLWPAFGNFVLHCEIASRSEMHWRDHGSFSHTGWKAGRHGRFKTASYDVKFPPGLSKKSPNTF